MKRFYLFLLALAISGLSFATPVDKYIPADYATIAAAVTALNGGAFTATGVTFHIASGYTESIGANIMITATGTSTTPILFEGVFASHAVITRTDAGTLTTSTLGGQGDAVILIEGGDYITFRYVDVAASASTIEYGYYLRKLSATDACKNVTIQNCVVDMTKGTTAYTTGIYVSNNVLASTVSSATGVTVTAAGGISENIIIRANTIQDVFAGIILRGSSAAGFLDMNNEVGAIDNGNTIQNYGGNNTGTSYGVYMIYQGSVNVNNNTINNTANGGSPFTGTAYGIFHSTATNGNGNYNYNSITLSSTTGTLKAISFGTTGTAVHNANNNTINISMAGVSEIDGIYLAAAVGTLTCNNNTFSFGTNNSTSTSSCALIYASTATNNVTISGNQTSGTLTKAGGALYGYYNSGSPTGGTETITNNNFSNLIVSTGSSVLGGIYSNTAVAQSRVCNNNTITNLTHSGTGIVYGLAALSALTNQVNNNSVNTITGGGTIYGLYFTGTNPTVYNNNINNITTSGSILYGLYDGGTGTTNCYKNKVYNLTNNSTTGTLSGIYVSAGTINNVYNNFVSDLKVPSSTSILITGLNGIYVAGGTSIGLYYNSVYLDATSAGATFGSAAIGASTTPTLDLRNNIFVNNSVAGASGGKTLAFRRSSTTITTYSANSNGNCFYAGSGNDSVYYDGAVAYTMAGFKTLVGPVADANSFRALPPFINVATTPYDLHINPASPTGCESGGIAMTGVIDNDYDNDIRWNSPGYPTQTNGGGVAVDIGADEFDGVPNYTCNIVNPEATLASVNPICLGTSVILSMQNEPVGTGMTYQWQSSTNGTTWANVSGAIYATLTATPLIPTWYKCIASCVNGPNGESIPLQVTFNGEITSHTDGSRCGVGTVDLAATGSGWGTLSWYTTPVGGSVALGNGPSYTTLPISSTTSYYVGEENYSAANVAIGAGALTSATYSNPFYSAYSNNHTQHIILASELAAAGIYAGNINSVALDVTSAGTLPMLDLAVKIGTTTASDMSAFVPNTGFTTVYTNASLLPTVGLNVLTFSPAFNWDGVSNIVLEFCHGNGASTATMSRTVKFDNTAYISTIKAHFNAATAASVECANTTNLPVTYSGRPQFTINGQTVCSSPRTEVVATVTEALPLTVSADETICNNNIATLSVTSTLANYTSYVWTPITNLFSDAACTIPYPGNSDTTVYYKSTTAGVHTFTCTAYNSNTLCGNTDTIVITNLPATISISAPDTTFCISGSTVLFASPAIGYGAAALQWQSSTNGTSFSDISGAYATTDSVHSLTITTWYKLQVKIGATVCTESNIFKIRVHNPQVTGTTPATRCGIGTVNLSATGSAGSVLSWYTAPTGGSPVATGPNYITPPINTTTSYYVSANEGGVSGNVGKTAYETGGYNTGGYLIFTSYQPFTLNSVVIYPYSSTQGTTGTITIALQNSSGATLQSYVANVTGYPTTNPQPQVVPVNFNVPAGTDLRLTLVSYTGVSGALRDYNVPYAYPYTYPGYVSITASSLATYYYFFYNWSISAGCESARTPVVATVTPPPAFTVTANQTTCNNAVATMSVTSNIADYNSFIWSPSTNLFTDVNCTLPYTGTSASTVYFRSAIGGSYPYLCTASQTAGNLCVDTSATTLINLPATPIVSAAPSQICISGASTIALSPTTGWGTATFQWQDSPDGNTYSDISGEIGMNYTTDTLTTTTYYRLNISNSAGLCTQLPITMVVNNPQITGTTPGSRCGFGTVTLGASVTGGSLNWYDNAGGGNPIATGTSFTTPIISTTTSYWVGAVSGYLESYVGMAAASSGSSSGSGTTNVGLVFDALSAFTLKSVTVYPVSSTGASGTVTIDILDANNVVLHTATVNVTGSPAASLVAQVIDLNFNILPGTNLKMRHTKTGISGLLFEPSAAVPPSGSYPYPYVIPGVLSINTSTLTVAPTNTARNDLYYYFYNWKVAVGCVTPLQEVVATVTAPPTLTLSNNQSVCNNGVATINVLSTLPNFDTYVWTPVTDLYTNLACTTPYTTGSSASTVYYKSATAGTHLYTCTATKTSSACVNVVQTAVTNLPSTLTITATPSDICFSGSSYLQPTQLSGWGTASFQWQDSPDGITYTNIPTGLNIDYTSPTITSTTYYKLLVMNGINECVSATKMVAVHNPQISGTNGATRCGIGTVQLTAAGSGGTLNWFDSPTSGTVLGSGTSFTTPIISSTTNYYVASEYVLPPTVLAVGAGATTSATYSNPFYSAWSNIHTQHIILASELTAAGIYPGNLTSVALDITSAGTLPMLDLSVKIGATSASDMTAFITSGLTQVYSSASYMPTAGINTLTFSTPFYWDGASNIVLEFCHGNPASSATMSRTAKADATSYISSIKTNISAAASAATICGDITTGKATYSVRPQFTFGNNPGCFSPRVAVEATVTPPPALTVSANQTICSNAAGTLSVTSTLSNFNTYTWTPVTDLFTDAGCTIPYTTQNLSTVYVKSVSGGTTIYTCSALNTGDGCANIAQTTVTVIPANPTITSTPEHICVSGSALLSLSPASGYGSGSFQWQDSPNGITYTDILGEVNSSYTTPVVNTQSYYQVLVKDGTGTVCATPQYTLIVDNPVISSTTDATRCGVGTVQLGAVYSGGTLNWYSSASSGTILGTGASFTTPVISSTTTYYAQCVSPGSMSGSVGPLTNAIGAGDPSSLTHYTKFNVIAPSITLQGVYVYPGAAGNVILHISNSAGTVLTTITYPVTTTGVKTYIPINYTIPTGTDYRIGWSTGSVSLFRNTAGASYPYTLPGYVSITGNSFDVNYFYYVYDWQVQIGCATSRVPVVATVTPPPALTITADQTICNNTMATLSVLSTLSDFDTYIWSPSTDLYTDLACTVPYNGTSSATTLYYKSATGVSQDYTCTATQTSSNCVNVAHSVINNMPASPAITSSGSICGSGSAILSLSPATGWGAATFQWQTSANGTLYTDISGAIGITYTTPSTDTITYYQVIIKNGAGTICSTPQYTEVVNTPQILSTAPSTQCGYGYATLGATGTGGTLKWYANATGGSSIGTGPSFTTPLILTTTSFYVESDAGSGQQASVAPLTNGIGAGGYFTSTLYYTSFNVLSSNMTLNGVYVYPETAGNVKLYIADNNGTVLHNVTYAVTTPGVKTYVPINYNLVGGTGYRIGPNSGSVILYRNSAGASYPYTLAGTVSITGNNYNAVYLYHYYDWSVTPGCTSARQQVVATVTPAPAITLTGTSPICEGQTTTLNVTGDPSYDLFMWLTTNDTIPGATQVKSPTTTTVYTAVAISNTTGCVNADVFPVIVYPAPSTVTVTPPTGYTGTITQLTASGGSPIGITTLNEGFETFPSANFAASDTNIKPTSNTTYYSAGNKSVRLAHNTNITASYSLQHDINMTGYSVAQLTFSHICGMEDPALAFDLGYVEYSTNGGTSWTVFPASSYAGSGTLITTQGASTPVSGVIFSNRSYPDWMTQFTSETATPGAGPATSLWKTETINVPSAALASTQFRVRFKIVADPLTVYYGWLIDNVNISGTSNVTYTWSPTTDLYTDAAATIPYTGGTANTVYANPASSVVYTATTSNAYNCSGSGSASIEPLTKTLEARIFLEGLYAGGGMMNQAIGLSGPEYGTNIADVVTVKLHHATAPYAMALEFSPVDLHTDGSLAVSAIPGNLTGSYYIVILHRNSVETWSGNPVDFSGAGPIIFDFSTAASQAYGSNQLFKANGSAWVIFAGDVSQDGVVDGSDLAAVDNASASVLVGYNPEDVNGDGVVDGSDLATIDNNSAAVIQVMKP